MQESTEANPKPGSEKEVAQEQVRSEIQEYLFVSRQRRRLFPLAAFVGLLAGLVAIAFRAILAGGDAVRNALIAGAHAGLAAAFNAPLAGLVFVLEEVQKDFRQAVFGAAFVAAATADIVARFASGQLPVFRVPSYPVPALSALPMFAILGIACGL